MPWVCLDRTPTPNGRELRLLRRGDEIAIMLDRDELMNSRRGASEAVLATLPCGRLQDRPAARVLIGGLGLGFTLRAALGALGQDARIVVAELVPAIVAWARGPLDALFAGSLSDPRVSLVVGDVGPLIRGSPGGYDAILLDVDNGPDGLVQGANDGLYGIAGLRAAWRALRPGGILAVWSAGPDARFMQRLRAAGFIVEEASVRAGGRSGPRHVVWVATHPGGGGSG